jgi:gluconate kinase
MIILFGGLVGTGKTELARAVAQNLNIFYYEIDKAKAEVISANAALQFNMKYNKPYSEEAKLMIYSRALQHLSDLSKKHKDIVADEDLHKKHSRSIFFDRIRESMGGLLFVWLTVDENVVRDRLAARQRQGHLLKEPFGMYLAMKKSLNLPEEADIQFENNEPLDVSCEKLTELVRNRLPQTLP